MLAFAHTRAISDCFLTLGQLATAFSGEEQLHLSRLSALLRLLTDILRIDGALTGSNILLTSSINNALPAA